MEIEPSPGRLSVKEKSPSAAVAHYTADGDFFIIR